MKYKIAHYITYIIRNTNLLRNVFVYLLSFRHVSTSVLGPSSWSSLKMDQELRPEPVGKIKNK